MLLISQSDTAWQPSHALYILHLAAACCIAVFQQTHAVADRTFTVYMASTARLPNAAMERVGPTYVASVIAAFRAIIGAEPAARIEPGKEDEHTRYVAAAVLPLTELLARRGLIDTVNVADWLLAGGEMLAGVLPDKVPEVSGRQCFGASFAIVARRRPTMFRAGM